MHSAFRFAWMIIIVVCAFWPPLAVLAAILWESVFGPMSGDMLGRSGHFMGFSCMAMSMSATYNATYHLRPEDQSVGRLLRLFLPGMIASAAICLTTGILLRIAWEETNDINSRSAVGLLLGAGTSAAMYLTYQLIRRSHAMQALAGEPSDAIADQQR